MFCSDVFIDADGREFGRLVLPPEIAGSKSLSYATILNALLVHSNSFLRCPTAIVRASVYQAVGVYRDKEFKNTSDLEMWLRIARRYEIGVLEDHLLRYRRGHGSSSEQYHRVRTEPFRLFRILDAELKAGGRRSRSLTPCGPTKPTATSMSCCGQSTITSSAKRPPRFARSRRREFGLARSGAIQRGRMVALALGLPAPAPTANPGGGSALRPSLACRAPARRSKLMWRRRRRLRPSREQRDRRRDARPPDPSRPRQRGTLAVDDQRVCLGHRRLVIVDPSPASNQPFVSADGNFVTVFNGEIYNFRDLRRELEREACRSGLVRIPRC